jgi:hypothetical protein
MAFVRTSSCSSRSVRREASRIFNEREPTRAQGDVEEGYSCLDAAVQGFPMGNPWASRARNYLISCEPW